MDVADRYDDFLRDLDAFTPVTEATLDRRLRNNNTRRRRPKKTSKRKAQRLYAKGLAQPLPRLAPLVDADAFDRGPASVASVASVSTRQSKSLPRLPRPLAPLEKAEAAAAAARLQAAVSKRAGARAVTKTARRLEDASGRWSRHRRGARRGYAEGDPTARGADEDPTDTTRGSARGRPKQKDTARGAGVRV
mmetsp:Transcript_20251/g.63719  ORF Transcript_20251/g.63719 Transcript_20251/m.63719 type:complete len:192 (+) Transcript_20251:246-821(+)